MAKITKLESDKIRTKLLELTYLNRNSDDFDTSYRAIANELGEIDVRTVKQAASDVFKFCGQLSLNLDGIHFSSIPNTFYERNSLLEDDIKDKLSDTFVLDIKNNQQFNAFSAFIFSNGTTITKSALKLLPHRDLYNVLITTNLGIIEAIKERDIYNLILCGGQVNRNVNGCIGSQAIKSLEEMRCEVAVLGVSGINCKGELFVRFAEETEILKKIAQLATSHVYIIASATKLCQEDTFKFLDLNDFLENTKKKDVKVRFIISNYEQLQDSKQISRAKEVYEELRKMSNRVKVIMTP